MHVHAETGEKPLLLGPFAKRIKGLRSNESAALNWRSELAPTSPPTRCPVLKWVCTLSSTALFRSFFSSSVHGGNFHFTMHESINIEV